MSSFEIVTNALEDLGSKEFLVEDLIKKCNPPVIKETAKVYLRAYIKTNGVAVVGTVKSPNGNKPMTVYKVLNLNRYEASRFYSIESSAYKRVMDQKEMYSDENHPAKKYISDHFYTAFSIFSQNTSTVLSLCGPNILRFVNNVLKITRKETGFVKLVECCRDTKRTIEHHLDDINIRKYFPSYSIENIQLEDLNDDIFYQFEELDCEGIWERMYPLYEKRLINQAMDTTLTKGMIVTTYTRGKRNKNPHINKYLSSLLSRLGARFKGDEVLVRDVRRSIPGNGKWLYLNLYDTFPTNTTMGRIQKLICSKYSCHGQMFTCLIIYK